MDLWLVNVPLGSSRMEFGEFVELIGILKVVIQALLTKRKNDEIVCWNSTAPIPTSTLWNPFSLAQQTSFIFIVHPTIKWLKWLIVPLLRHSCLDIWQKGRRPTGLGHSCHRREIQKMPCENVENYKNDGIPLNCLGSPTWIKDVEDYFKYRSLSN